MRWPSWSSKFSSSTSDDSSHPPSLATPVQTPATHSSWTQPLNSIDWSHYTSPRALIPTLILTSTILLSIRVHTIYLRRIPAASSIAPSFWRRRSLFGYVTSVGDGDNFRIFHTPGGRWAGWGWMWGRGIPVGRAELKDRTVSVFRGYEEL